MMTTTLNHTLPSSPAEVGEAWAELLRDIPGYDPFRDAEGYGFDERAAGHVIAWIEKRIKHAKGRIAGKPFMLERWEKAILANLFGWKNKKTGYRRYREAFIFVAKKNGKSALMAALLLYVICEDVEIGSEIYSAAASREQATLIFAHASGMVRQSDWLQKRLEVFGGKGISAAKAIVHEQQMATYKCLSADANTADGAAPSLSVVDELHRHKSPDLSDVLEKSTAEQAQPLTLYTTTSDHERVSVCNTKHEYARKVRDGQERDAQYLPVVYEASIEDDWESPETWRKANPNLGVTVQEDFFRREVAKCKADPTLLNSFLRLHLNIRTQQNTRCLDMNLWKKCEARRDLSELEGKECIGGLDLSSKEDLTAFVLLFEDETDAVDIVPWFWLPEDSLNRREMDQNAASLRAWANEGYLELIPGPRIDQRVIFNRIVELSERFRIREIAYDPWNAEAIRDRLEGEGFEMIQFSQGLRNFTEPMKEYKARVAASKIRHGDNPVMKWMAGNLAQYEDPNGNIRPNKAESGDRIDGQVCAIMALGRAMVAGDEAEEPGMAIA